MHRRGGARSHPGVISPGWGLRCEPWQEAEAYDDSGSGARLGTACDGRRDSGVSVGGGDLQRTAGERRRQSAG